MTENQNRNQKWTLKIYFKSAPSEPVNAVFDNPDACTGIMDHIERGDVFVRFIDKAGVVYLVATNDVSCMFCVSSSG